MPRPSTRDRILATSLRLFNDEGEPQVTTVDIANELGISPGNLYYHFKGKEALIRALYDAFEQTMDAFLEAPIQQPLEVADNWYYLYVLFEEIYQFRFFYRNLTDILQRYPLLRKRFRRLLEHKRRSALAIGASMAEAGVLVIAADELDRLADSIALTLTWFLMYEDLRLGELPAPLLLHKGVYQVLSLVTPHFDPRHRGFSLACRELYETALASAGR